MSQSTFALRPAFGEQVFARFSKALADLRSDPRLAERLEIYSRVSSQDLTTFLSSAFWASLSPEEGRYHGFRISLGPPSQLGSDYSFVQPQPFSSEQISDLAAVLANSQKSLGVWFSAGGGLHIWGLADLGYWDIQVVTSRPGQLLFSVLGGGETSFKVAISGSWWGIVDQTRIPFTSVYTGGTHPNPYDSLDTGIDKYLRAFQRSYSYESIARTILRHGHGGALLIVPDDSDLWKASCSIRYAADGLFQETRENVDAWETALQREADAGRWFFHDASTERSRERAIQSLEMVAQLTAVDGATIIGRELTVYGFGAKLAPLEPNMRPETIRVSRPFEDAEYETVRLSDLGGTRHQSAAQFVFDQKGCVAIVCSQDGRLSALNWDTTQEAVVMITNLEYAL